MEREKKTWWSDSLKKRERLKERKCRWNGSVYGSNESLYGLFFHSVLAAHVQDVFQDLPLIHFPVFSVHTVLTKSKWWSARDVFIGLHTVLMDKCHHFFQSGCIFYVFLSWLQKHMGEECLIAEPHCGRLMDRFLPPTVGAAGQSPVDVLKCGCLKELSALPAPWQVMDREADCIRTYVMSPIWNQTRVNEILRLWNDARK